MAQIVLTEEQARVLAKAEGPVEVRDSQGRALGSATPLRPADVEAIRQSKLALPSREPPILGEKVQALLQKFDEVDQREGLDETKAEELLRQLFVGEQP
jgi:hypothetical protein